MAPVPPRGLELRSLTPADGDVVRRLVDSVSAETLHRRFQHAVQRAEVDLSWVGRLAGRDDVAIVACGPGGGAPLGIARAVRHDDGAEIAVMVTDAWQGRRVGSRLARRLADELAEQGVTWLSGFVSLDNRAAVALMRRLGARRVGEIESGAMEMRVSLRGRNPAGEPAIGRRAAVA